MKAPSLKFDENSEYGLHKLKCDPEALRKLNTKMLIKDLNNIVDTVVNNLVYETLGGTTKKDIEDLIGEGFDKLYIDHVIADYKII